MNISKYAQHQNGLSLIETVIGVALFALVALMLSTTYSRVFITVRSAQARVNAVALVNEQMEIARNLPYSNIGTVSGVPLGVLLSVQTLTRGGMTFVATTTVRNIDLPFDGVAGGSPNDLSPADNKLVEVEINCTSCKNFRPMTLTTSIGPKDLEASSTNGSLFILALDQTGLGIQNADVHIWSNTTTPIDIHDITSTSGTYQLVDAPPGTEAYQIWLSKSGYSSEQTYARTATTSNPVKPNATVLAQAVTQVSFIIDKLANVSLSSVSPSCAAVPNVNLHMSGAKLISSAPNVLKYDKWLKTDAGGSLNLGGTEWDTYNIVATSSLYELAGVVPLLPVAIAPGSTQNVQIVMVPKNSPSVLVTVKDSATGLPVTGAVVTLEQSGASTTLTTGRGFLSQTDWSGGGGQSDFTNQSKYQSDDSGIDATSVPGEVKLRDILGLFAMAGTLYSSTFDTGSASNFYQFLYQSTNQPIAAGDSVKFQLATGNSTSSWTYLGPDGTSGTYYNSTTTDISAVTNGHRYLRYKMMLSTASSSYTPSVSDVQFTFTSSCVPPGQVLFQDLATGSYNLTVEKTGYVTATNVVSVTAGSWQEVQETIGP